jgi:uncharacterized membrane protein (DUF2068 family)
MEQDRSGLAWVFIILAIYAVIIAVETLKLWLE